MTLGIVSCLSLVLSIGVWSIGTQIAGAVVAQGATEHEFERQVVQHPDGGVVGEITAREGDAVQKGDVLLRLDDTFLLSELRIVERQLFELLVRQARLIAEREDAVSLALPFAGQFERLDANWKTAQVEGQVNLFDARRVSLTQEIDQLDEQRRQTENRIEGLRAQKAAAQRELELAADLLKIQRSLYAKGLVVASDLTLLERQSAQLEGEVGRLTASIAQSLGEIAEIEIGILSRFNLRRENAISDLRDLRYNEIELRERRGSLRERLSRLDVRAPASGVVFGSSVLALQSVIQPAAPIMYLVPDQQPLFANVRVDPNQIDQVYPGQPVILRFSAFEQSDVPEIEGRVLRISADVLFDQSSGRPYYEVIVRPKIEQIPEIMERKLLPGMPVEAFIRTSDRAPIEYLTQPLMTYLNRAFREN